MIQEKNETLWKKILNLYKKENPLKSEQINTKLKPCKYNNKLKLYKVS